MSHSYLPVGKLPPDLQASLLSKVPLLDERILLGPRPGVDCAVIDLGATLLVFKSDPITFVTGEIGWYAVQINANDIAVMGATPRWFLATLLLPEEQATPELVKEIQAQINSACREIGVSVIGGHTEVTHGLDRPILAGSLIGEVSRAGLVTSSGARPGDRLLLTKSIPIEATAILAREFQAALKSSFSEEDLRQARNYLHDPGISVLRDAQIAVCNGHVTAMHDPTEGGLAAALWELAEACGHALLVRPKAIPISPLSARLCRFFGLDPLACIASGALLLSVAPEDAPAILEALNAGGVLCREIGSVREGQPVVWMEQASQRRRLPRPARDEVAKLYDRSQG